MATRSRQKQKSEPSRRNRTILVKDVPEDHHQALKILGATKDGGSMSSEVREAIKEYVERHPIKKAVNESTTQ